MKLGTCNTANILQSSTGYIKIPNGTTAQRPSSPSHGMLRFNTDLGYIEHYLNEWVSVDTQMAHPGFQQNIYYGSPVVDNNPVNNNYFNSGYLFALPFYVPMNSVFNRVGFSVTSYTGSPSVTISIYSNTNGYPDQLLYNVGSVPINGTGNKEIVFSNSASCNNKWVWICVYTTVGLNLVAYNYSSNGNYYLGRVSPTATSTIGAQSPYFTGSLPSSFGTITPIINVSPYIWIRNV